MGELSQRPLGGIIRCNSKNALGIPRRYQALRCRGRFLGDEDIDVLANVPDLDTRSAQPCSFFTSIPFKPFTIHIETIYVGFCGSGDVDFAKLR